jgi:hypothetical protein
MLRLQWAWNLAQSLSSFQIWQPALAHLLSEAKKNKGTVSIRLSGSPTSTHAKIIVEHYPHLEDVRLERVVWCIGEHLRGNVAAVIVWIV